MIQSAAKIKIDKTELGVVVSIYPELFLWQKLILGFWIVAWTLSGLLAIAGMLANSTESQGIYIMVFFAFWIYFLFFGLRSFFWNHYGKEFLRISSETLDYKRSWGQYGTVKSFDMSTMKNLGLLNLKMTSFAKTYQDAFWTIGGETLGFEYFGHKIGFGLRLEEKDAQQIVKLMMTEAKKNESTK